MSNHTARYKDFEELGKILESSGITAKHSGVSTPYNLLLNITAEVRELRKVHDEQLRQTTAIVSALQQQNETMMRQLEESRTQTDTLATMLRTLDRPVSMGTSSPIIPPTPTGRRTSSIAERAYYCEGQKVTTGPGVIAVVLLQIMNVVADEYMSAQHSSITNDNPLSFKELRSVVSAASAPEPCITLPKLSSSSTQEALKYVCSTDPSIPTRCTATHLADVTRECSQVLSVVEQIRKRLLQCEGVLGPYQHMCLAYVEYPYACGTELVSTQNFDAGRMSKSIRFKNSTVRRMKPGVRNVFMESMMNGKGYGVSCAEATSAD